MVSAEFRFNRGDHTYTDPTTGRRFEHITGLLTVAGHVDERWYTEESSHRGRAVHKLTAELDLGALDIDEYEGIYRGYLLGWEHAKALLQQPVFLHVETPAVHPELKFGGCPDRAAELFGAKSVVELKTGDPAKGHPYQTALQAILVAPEFNLPAESIQRYAIYVNDSGRAKVEQHTNPADFREAYRIIRRYCR